MDYRTGLATLLSSPLVVIVAVVVIVALAYLVFRLVSSLPLPLPLPILPLVRPYSRVSVNEMDHS